MSDLSAVPDDELMRALGAAPAQTPRPTARPRSDVLRRPKVTPPTAASESRGGSPLVEVEGPDGQRVLVREDQWSDGARKSLPIFHAETGNRIGRDAPRETLRQPADQAANSAGAVSDLNDDELMRALGTGQPDDTGGEDEGFLGTLDAGIRGAADTLSFGFADEFAAAMGALTGVGGEFGEYNRNLEAQRTMDRDDEERHSVSRITGQLAGGVAGGVGLAKSGATLVRAGQSLPVAMGAGAVEGAAFGAAQGFGSGEGGVGERVASAGEGAAWGAPIGAAAPVVAKGVGALTRAMRGAGHPDPALRMVVDDLAAEGVPPSEMARRAQALGPEGMIADTTDTLRLRAEQIANADNPGRPAVVGALRDRSAGGAARVHGAWDDQLGATPNVKELLDNATSAKKRLADDLYGEARKVARPVNTTPLIESIDRALYSDIETAVQARSSATPDALDREMSWLMGRLTGAGNHRSTAGAVQVVDFNKLHTLQRDLAEKARSYAARGEGYVAKRLNVARGKLLDALDAATERKPGDHSSSLYASARRHFADDSAVEEAFDIGRNAFSSRAHPDFVAADLAKMSAAERDAVEIGLRVAADEAMGRVRNGALKGRTLLDADFNERKVVAILGEDRGRALINRLLGETKMADTANQVLGNSATARRVDNPFRQQRGQNPVGVVRSLLNLRLGDAGARAWEGVADFLGERQAKALAERLGPILIAGGAERDAAIENIMRAADAMKRAGAARQGVEGASRGAVMGGGRGAVEVGGDRW